MPQSNPPPMKKRIIANKNNSNIYSSSSSTTASKTLSTSLSSNNNTKSRAVAVKAHSSYGSKKRSNGKQSYSRRSFKNKRRHGEPSELVDGWQDVLQKQYANNPYPTSEDYDRLAIETGMERRLVPRWFINMRKGGMSKTYNDSGARTSTNSPRRSKANHSLLNVEGDLEKEFIKYPYPTPLQYQQLATRLKVEKKLVRRWFISRRRTKAQLEQQQLEKQQQEEKEQKEKEQKQKGVKNEYGMYVPSKLSKSSSPTSNSNNGNTGTNSASGTAAATTTTTTTSSGNKSGQSSGSNSTTSSPSSIDNNSVDLTNISPINDNNGDLIDGDNSDNNDSNDNNQKQDKMMTIHSNNYNKQIATKSDPSLMENPVQCEKPIFSSNNKIMDSSTMISPSKTPMGDLDSSYLNGKPTSMDVSPLRNLVDNVMGGNTVTTSPVNIDNTNDLQPINVNFQSINNNYFGDNNTVVPVSPSAYSYTDPNGIVVSVVQAVGIDDIDSNELAAAFASGDSNFNGQYAVGTYIDDGDLVELTKQEINL